MKPEQRNLIIGLLMGIILTVNSAGLVFFTDLTTIWGVFATIGRVIVVVFMAMVLTLFFVSSED